MHFVLWHHGVEAWSSDGIGIDIEHSNTLHVETGSTNSKLVTGETDTGESSELVVTGLMQRMCLLKINTSDVDTV